MCGLSLVTAVFLYRRNLISWGVRTLYSPTKTTLNPHHVGLADVYWPPVNLEYASTQQLECDSDVSSLTPLDKGPIVNPTCNESTSRSIVTDHAPAALDPCPAALFLRQGAEGEKRVWPKE